MTFLASYFTVYGIENTFPGLTQPILNFIKGDRSISSLTSIANSINVTNPAAGSTGVGGMLILSFMSLGLLLLTPKISDMIKAFLARKPFEYGTAIGEAVGQGIGPVRGVAGMTLMGVGPKIAEGVSYPGGKRPSGAPASSLETGIARLTELLGKKIAG